MKCPQCGRDVGDTDRFCNGCGGALPEHTSTESAATVTEDLPATEPMPATDPAPAPSGTAAEGTATAAPVDVTIATSDLPVTQPLATATTQTADLPATEPITEVWMEPVPETAHAEPPAATTPLPAQSGTTATMPVVVTTATAVPDHRFRFNLLLLISLVTGAVSLFALFANVVSISSDTRLVAVDGTPDDFRTGTWIVDDLADNLSIAGLVAIAAMVAGGIAASFRWRWGAGLAGGAGLAMAGLTALTLGLAQFPIDSARAFARIPTDDPFVLTITRDLGYWLLIAAAALGVVLFFAAINDAFGDRRPGLNPWIAALGALAVVVTAAGPLLPENQAVFSDNWYLIEGPGEAPAALLAGRLVQIALFGFAGVVGFLSVRRWGLGLAIGVSLPVIWLVISTLFELTDDPVGLGYQNQGAVDMHVHGVTIIGTSGLLAMIILAVVAAYDQSVRERR